MQLVTFSRKAWHNTFLWSCSQFVFRTLQFFNDDRNELQTLYVPRGKVAPNTGPKVPIRVYVLLRMLKNHQNPFTERHAESGYRCTDRYDLRVKGYLSARNYIKFIIYGSHVDPLLLCESNGWIPQIRFVLVSKCTALRLGCLQKQSRHPVCTTSSDKGVGRRRSSGRLLTSVRGKRGTVTPKKRYSNEYVTFTHDKTWDFKTIHPRCAILLIKTDDTFVYPYSYHVLMEDGEGQVYPVHMKVYGEVEI
jgi:hypothetical protein